VKADGMDVTTQVAWSYERPDIGDITMGSTFTPTGKVGGVGKLQATLGKSTADTTVTVSVKNTVNPGMLTPVQQSGFGNPNGGPDPAMALVYPNAETVFPLGVLAPDFQWNGTSASDLYQLTITEKHYTYTAYLSTLALPAHYLMTEDDWKS